MIDGDGQAMAADSPVASAIRFDDVSFSYRPGTTFIEGLDVRLRNGVVTSIVGPNGCGKSTIVKLASGLLRPAAGHVQVKGRDMAGLSARERAKTMAVLAQSSRVPPMSVSALVACGRHPHRGFGSRLGAYDRERVDAAMERAGVARFRNHDLRQLSGGERQRAFLAMTLAQDTDLIVLDEPTTYLDINACHDLMALLRDLNRREGKTVVMVIHDLDLALRYSDEIVAVKAGAVAGQGPAEDMVGSGVLGDVFSMDICVHDRTDAAGGCAHGRPDAAGGEDVHERIDAAGWCMHGRADTADRCAHGRPDAAGWCMHGQSDAMGGEGADPVPQRGYVLYPR